MNHSVPWLQCRPRDRSSGPHRSWWGLVGWAHNWSLGPDRPRRRCWCWLGGKGRTDHWSGAMASTQGRLARWSDRWSNDWSPGANGPKCWWPWIRPVSGARWHWANGRHVTISIGTMGDHRPWLNITHIWRPGETDEIGKEPSNRRIDAIVLALAWRTHVGELAPRRHPLLTEPSPATPIPVPATFQPQPVGSRGGRPLCRNRVANPWSLAACLLAPTSSQPDSGC